MQSLLPCDSYSSFLRKYFAFRRVVWRHARNSKLWMGEASYQLSDPQIIKYGRDRPRPKSKEKIKFCPGGASVSYQKGVRLCSCRTTFLVHVGTLSSDRDLLCVHFRAHCSTLMGPFVHQVDPNCA